MITLFEFTILLVSSFLYAADAWKYSSSNLHGQQYLIRHDAPEEFLSEDDYSNRRVLKGEYDWLLTAGPIAFIVSITLCCAACCCTSRHWRGRKYKAALQEAKMDVISSSQPAEDCEAYAFEEGFIPTSGKYTASFQEEGFIESTTAFFKLHFIAFRGKTIFDITGCANFKPCGRSEILEGQVSLETGKAYWVEDGESGVVLNTGIFFDHCFEGVRIDKIGKRNNYDSFSLLSPFTEIETDSDSCSSS